jgi:hypothetical protein
MLTILAFAAAAASHAGIPYDPPTTPIDNAVARVQLSATVPEVVTAPHVHLTNRVMIYFQAGTNTIRYADGKVSVEHFRAGDVLWNNAMGTHTATITAAGPVDLVHVELKSSPTMVPTIKSPAPDPAHFKVALDNNQVRVLRLHLGKGERTTTTDERLERLLVPLTAAQLKTAGSDGGLKAVHYRPGDVQWLMPGRQSDENTGPAPYDAIIVEFKK